MIARFFPLYRRKIIRFKKKIKNTISLSYMFSSTSLIFLLLIITTLCAISFPSAAIAADKPHRKCRLVAVADLHGDLAQTRKVLKDVAKLIDGADRWIGGCATLVQLGDLVDRGHESLQVIDFLVQLQAKARKHGPGGRVVILTGNHHLMLMAGNLAYASDLEVGKKGGEAAFRNLFSRRGTYGQILRRWPVVWVDAESGTVFVHGGIRPEWAAVGVEEMNRRALDQMQRDKMSTGVFGNDGPLWDRTVIQQAILGSQEQQQLQQQQNRGNTVAEVDDGAFYSAGTGGVNNGKIQKRNVAPGGGGGGCKLLFRSLQILGANRMVVGHTPQVGGKIGMYCDRKLVAADVGISGMMMNKLGAVEIMGDGEVVELY